MTRYLTVSSTEIASQSITAAQLSELKWHIRRIADQLRLSSHVGMAITSYLVKKYQSPSRRLEDFPEAQLDSARKELAEMLSKAKNHRLSLEAAEQRFVRVLLCRPRNTDVVWIPIKSLESLGRGLS